ncbi:hypothetical protein OPT61_g1356 [Boeremia exigua]|uniref:Uncharacterized protein n=1 Tax=Boeremia exigua TaxID=749465 RepID=A0ACC2IQF3_9PLEO|nr:hypothetical protein OPT61_g1356 [Boeremia exigua]
MPKLAPAAINARGPLAAPHPVEQDLWRLGHRPWCRNKTSPPSLATAAKAPDIIHPVPSTANMKTFAIASVLALATVASAQLEKIPSCAFTCFVGPLTTDGCSGLTDFACHCKQGAKLLGAVQPCVKGACSAEDEATTIEAVQTTCQEAGVPIEIPDSPSSAASAAPSTPSPSSAAPTTIADPTSALQSSAASAASSAAESVASSIASAITSAVSAYPTGNGTAPTHPSSSLSEFTGAAAQATQAAGLLGAAALALLAL